MTEKLLAVIFVFINSVISYDWLRWRHAADGD